MAEINIPFDPANFAGGPITNQFMLSNTIGLLDLFSGLYHGHLRGQNEAHLVVTSGVRSADL